MPRSLPCLSLLFSLVAGHALAAGATPQTPAVGPKPQTPAAAPTWTDFMPAEVIGARSFVKGKPELDGRGLVVAVLDTGVDPRASGLDKTSDGKVKVIEARDFTGQGDVALEEAGVTQEGGGKLRISVGNVELRGVEALGKPEDGVWWLGSFREAQIGPTELQDLNHNGKGDDEIAVLVWRTGPGPDDVRVLLDLSGDGQVAGETVVRPYHVAQELILPPTPKRTQDAVLLSLAAEVDWLQRKAVLHFTDGSHGTHVAGIIAGYQVFGKPGWDGVAPGAQILSLKIGHNALSGGATTTESFKKALEFCAAWTRRTGRPLVVNGSYGIGSAIERQSDIDKLVDRLVKQNPLLTITFSAGNAGPGISSVGTPAAADLALAVGALLPREVAPTLYGGRIEQHEMFSFSSRGGELNKPEVVAPGVAATSVPLWDGREVKNGTSMASPHVAGAMLLVWAGLLQDAGGKSVQELGFHGGLVRRALILSARPIAGYSQLDQGRGLIDVPRAAELVKRLAKRPEPLQVLGYHLASQAPRPDGHRMPATYWRTGLFLPGGPLATRTEVTALLPAALAAEDRERFSQVYELQADADWLELVRNRVHLRADRPSPFEVRFRADRLQTPGLYTAKVIARPVGAAADEVAFESWQTVVVPHRFEAANRYQKTWSDVRLRPGKVWRQWVLVPPGARQVRVTASRRPGPHAEVALALFDPDGDRIRPRQRVVSSLDGTDAEWLGASRELKPGTWEVTLAAGVGQADESHVDVEIVFAGADVDGPGKLQAKSGSLVSGQVRVTNLFDQPFVGTGEAAVSRVVKKGKVTVSEDAHVQKVTIGPQFSGVSLYLSVDKQVYGKTTDIAVVVTDAQGKEVASAAFGTPEAEVRWKRGAAPGDQTFTLRVEPGFTHRRTAPWKLSIEQQFQLARPVALTVKGPDGPNLLLYPTVPVTIDVQATEGLPALPDGFRHGGDLDLKTADGKRRWLTVALEGK